MESGTSGTVLTKDLLTADGKVVASRGEVVDLAMLKDVAVKAPRGVRERPLFETTHAEAVLQAFESPALQHLAGDEAARAMAADALAEVRFPQAVWDELESLQKHDAPRYQHAIFTGITAARLFRAALGIGPAVPRMVAGALVHDIGMLHVGLRLRLKRDHLTRAEAMALEDHPLLGALLLASMLGDAPSVHFALLHHTRAGFGYPKIEGTPPLRGLDLIAVASAFAALVCPRSYRVTPFNPRGAVDQLLEDSQAGHFDPRAVRLLIHCLRGGRGPLQDLPLPRKATGFRPTVNHHGLAPEARAA
jgi:HD-GYP domain-containing protein (c-di-GMP phosphodiesterase class II)